MSPDATTAAPTEPAEPNAAPAPAPSAEPARQASGPRLNTLQEAFRTAPEALKGTGRANGTDEKPSDSDAPGASAGSSEPALKPGDEPQHVSRRGAAARISEQQAEIERLVDERERERARVRDLEDATAAQTAAREERAKVVMARIGDDKEFAELSSKRMRGEVLSYEQDEQLNGMLAWRELAADLWEIAERAHKRSVVGGLADRADRYGLDKQRAFDATLSELLDHAVEVTEARVRTEAANEIAELTAELKGLRTGRAGGTAPTVGGASTPGGIAMPADGASPMDFFRAAERQREADARRAASRVPR